MTSVQAWEALVNSRTYDPNVAYTIVDLAQQINELQLNDIIAPLVAIQASDGNVVFNYDYAQAILKANIAVTSLTNNYVIFADQVATVLALSLSYIEQLNKLGFDEIGITDRAAAIQNLTSSQI